MGEQFAELFMFGLVLRLLGQCECRQSRLMGGAEQDQREGPPPAAVTGCQYSATMP